MDSRGLLKFLAPIRNRIMLMLARGIITATQMEKGLPTIRARLLADEEHGDIALMQQFGLASLPLPGCECLITFLGGERSQGVAVATADRRYVPADLQEGEVALYSGEDQLAFGEEAPDWAPEPPEGQAVQGLCRVALKKGRIAEIRAAQVNLVINGQLLSVNSAGGTIMLNSVVIPPMEEGGSRPSVSKLMGDLVEIDADSLVVKLGGKTFSFSAASMPARIGVDSAGGDVIEEGS